MAWASPPIFVRRFVLDGLGLAANLRAALRLVLLANLDHLVLDDLAQQVLVGQDLLQVRDAFADFLQLVQQLLALQTGQAAQAHLEDCFALTVGQPELLHQARFGLGIGLARADNRDDLVDVVERDDQALQDVGALFGLR